MLVKIVAEVWVYILYFTGQRHNELLKAKASHRWDLFHLTVHDFITSRELVQSSSREELNKSRANEGCGQGAAAFLPNFG